MQTVQYIQPQHAAQLSQAELLVIDEAAAIPLPVVKTLLGPYLVFLCSTVNGYEGTGRSLSLKLIEQLRTEVNSVVSMRSPWHDKDAAMKPSCLAFAHRRPERTHLAPPITEFAACLLSADLDLLSQAV